MKLPTKSPIKDKPLRLPGQSLEEERLKLFEEQVETPLLFAVLFLVLASLEWARYLWDRPPYPFAFTIVAVLSFGFVLWRISKARWRMQALKLGIEGEKAVGQFLERLREHGYQVFHDLVGTGFNVDHVLIGPAGVFTVETKTWSKPVKGEARIRFDGSQVTAASREPARDPIIQARAQSAWLKGLLSESTGRKFDVFPVVVFPGWFIENAAGSLRDIWVLEPKALPKFLEGAPQLLSAEDVKLASFHLSRFIRSGELDRSKGKKY